MKFLIDTCVLSEMMKSKPNPNVIDWINKFPHEDLFLSVLTLSEIRKGIHKLENITKKEQLNYWLKNYVIPKFEKTILIIDTRIAL